MGDVWAMVERLFTLPAMPATTPDPFSDLEKSLKDLRILVEDVKELIAMAEFEMRILKKQSPPEPQAMAPAVPVTSKKMPRGAIVDTIVTQLPIFLASCIEHHELTGDPAFNPIIKYRVNEFREHCEPFLPIGTADLEKDCNGTPKWIDRFNYAHIEAAKRRGFTSYGVGGWTVPAGYQ